MGFLSTKVAIITGASRGIGRAIALRLGAEGARCVLCARDAVALNGVLREIVDAGGDAVSLAIDLRIPDAPAQLAEFAVSTYSAIDIVVNNAGATRRAEFLDLTEADWADGFALKFFGAVRLACATWPHLRATRGSVVNIAGVGGRMPGSAFAVGGSVNAALLSFTKSLAETGLRDGVQVNAVSPGTIRTGRFQQRLLEFAARYDLDPADAERRFVADLKVTRIGEPCDIANLVAFVVGPQGRFLHGSVIDMDGGATKTL